MPQGSSRQAQMNCSMNFFSMISSRMGFSRMRYCRMVSSRIDSSRMNSSRMDPSRLKPFSLNIIRINPPGEYLQDEALWSEFRLGLIVFFWSTCVFFLSPRVYFLVTMSCRLFLFMLISFPRIGENIFLDICPGPLH